MLGVYAILRQQVIRRAELSSAYAKRSAALLWAVFFREKLTVRKLVGIGCIVLRMIAFYVG